MYETLIHQVVVWDRKLAIDEANYKIHQSLSSQLAETDVPSCRRICQTILTWNYRFEKDYHPVLFNSTANCVESVQTC